METSADRGRVEFFGAVGAMTLFLLAIALNVVMAIAVGSAGWAVFRLAFATTATYAAFVLFTSEAIDRYPADRKLVAVASTPTV